MQAGHLFCLPPEPALPIANGVSHFMRIFGILFALSFPISIIAQTQGLGVRFAPDSLRGGLRLLELSMERYGNGQSLWPGDRILVIDGQPVESKTPQDWRDFFKKNDTAEITIIFNRFGITDVIKIHRSVIVKGNWIPFVEPTLSAPDLCALIASLVATREHDYGPFLSDEYPIESDWLHSKIGAAACERVLFLVVRRPGLRRNIIEPHIHVSSFADSTQAFAAAEQLVKQLTGCEPIEGIKFTPNKTHSAALTYLVPTRVRPKAAYDEEAEADETVFLMEVRVTLASPATTAIPWRKPTYVLEIVLQ